MIRWTLIVSVFASGLFLVLAVVVSLVEANWHPPVPSSPQETFLYGSTGTEVMPLPVFQVLPDIFPELFQPAGKAAGDWVDQFGFVRGKEGVNYGLPLGISVSSYRPKSGAASPVPFVGFNCAICHTSKIRSSPSDPGVLVLGMANANIDLVAFGNAMQTAILDEKRLTPEAIAQAYEARFHQSLGTLDKFVISFWLQGARQQINAGLPMRDLPFGATDLRKAEMIPSGPGRNQPMTETVRFLIQRTPTWPGGGASKIPCIYHQSWRQWAQFDGSVRDPVTRNSLAALGVGASIYNLRVPGILNTLRQTSQFVSNLDGPKYEDVFKSAIDRVRAGRGATVYRQYCGDCHGWPGSKPGEWVKGSRQGIVIPYQEVGTDPARVTFRYYDQLAQLIYDFFPDGHPLKPGRQDLRPNKGDTLGFISSPLESLFTRGPYLHNGSVPTLAELINLKPRPAVFYRGTNLIDPADVGIVAPEKPDVKCYFEYDARLAGNLNIGHDYPWKYKGPGWNQGALLDLLEYLKTL